MNDVRNRVGDFFTARGRSLGLTASDAHAGLRDVTTAQRSCQLACTSGREGSASRISRNKH
jgi:hypothetical protein